MLTVPGIFDSASVHFVCQIMSQAVLINGAYKKNPCVYDKPWLFLFFLAFFPAGGGEGLFISWRLVLYTHFLRTPFKGMTLAVHKSKSKKIHDIY